MISLIILLLLLIYIYIYNIYFIYFIIIFKIGQKQLANSTSNPLNLKIAVDNIDGSSIERTNKLPEADFIKATK